MAKVEERSELEQAIAQALPHIDYPCDDPQCRDSTWDHDCNAGYGPDWLRAKRVASLFEQIGVIRDDLPWDIATVYDLNDWAAGMAAEDEAEGPMTGVFRMKPPEERPGHRNIRTL